MLFGLLLLTASYVISSHFLPWTSFQQELMAGAAATLIGVAALRRPGPWNWPISAITVAVVSLIPLAQAAAGLLLYPIDGVLAWAYLFGFALSVAVGAKSAETRRHELLDGLAGVFVAAALLSVGLVACQWLSIVPPLIGATPLPPGSRPFGNLAQPNHLATLLLWGLVSAAWLRHRGRIGTATLIVVGVYLCAGIALTQSRQAWVGVLLLAAWAAIARRRGIGSVNSWAVPAFAVLLALMVIAIGPLSDALQVSSGRSLDEIASKGTRLLHWQYMVDAVGRSPWIGYGWNELNVAQSLVAPDHPAVKEMVDHSHNLLLDLMVWNGLPVGLGIFAGVVWWFVRHLRRSSDPATAHLLALLIVVGAHASFEYPLSYAYFLLPVGLMVGAVDAMSPAARTITVARGLVGAMAVAIVTVVGVVAWDYVHVDAEHRQMRLDKFIVSDDATAKPPSDIRYITNWRDFLLAAQTEAYVGMPEPLVESMRKVHLRHPHPPILLRYAIVAGLNGRPEEASHALIVLCKVHAERRCDEGRAGWEALQGKYRQLRGISFPAPEEERKPK